MWPYATQATKLKMVVDVTTDAAGYAVVGFGGGLATGAYGIYTITAGLFGSTPTSSAHTDYTAYVTAFDRSRITCAGYKFVPYLTPETSQGMAGFITMPYESVAGYNGISISAMEADAIAHPLAEGLTTFVYPMEEPAFSSSHSFANYMPSTLLVIKGAKTGSAVGQLECYWNMEGVSDPSSVHAGGSTIEPLDPAAQAVGTHVSQQSSTQLVVSQTPGHRRLTSQGRAIADASAAALGYGVGGATGSLLSVTPAAYREAKKKLKRLLNSQGRS